NRSRRAARYSCRCSGAVYRPYPSAMCVARERAVSMIASATTWISRLVAWRVAWMTSAASATASCQTFNSRRPPDMRATSRVRTSERHQFLATPTVCPAAGSPWPPWRRSPPLETGGHHLIILRRRGPEKVGHEVVPPLANGIVRQPVARVGEDDHVEV